MHGNEWMHGWEGMWFGPLFMWVVPILLIVLVVWLVRGSYGSSPQSKSTRDAGTILDERFASGEIDVEDYQRRRDALNDRKSA